MGRTIAMSGGATGIGAALKQLLREQGDTVIVVDLKDCDIEADLATDAGRQAAVAGIRELAPAGLDGFVPCAGLGPNVSPHSLVSRVNYFGAVKMIEGLQDLLVKKGGAVVAVSSNSAVLPGLDEAHIEALLADDEERAAAIIDELDGHNAYAGSKNALAKWVRRNAPTYMAQGIRMNAIAPGMAKTPLTDGVFEDATFGQAMRDFSETIPYGSLADPEMIAEGIKWLLDNKAARFVSGTVLFVDGGQDAVIRPDEF